MKKTIEYDLGDDLYQVAPVKQGGCTKLVFISLRLDNKKLHSREGGYNYLKSRGWSSKDAESYLAAIRQEVTT